jgi:hypothetical protein
MSDWRPAGEVPELIGVLGSVINTSPPPLSQQMVSASEMYARQQTLGYNAYQHPQMYASPHLLPPGYGRMPGVVQGDKSRTAAGILNIVLPGVGRMYMGHVALGVLQFMLACCTGGILYVWSLIDGIRILTGGVNLDGYGRQLKD